MTLVLFFGLNVRCAPEVTCLRPRSPAGGGVMELLRSRALLEDKSLAAPPHRTPTAPFRRNAITLLASLIVLWARHSPS